VDALKAWGRGLAQLAIACAVTLLVLAPSLDAVLCSEAKLAPTITSAEPGPHIKMVASGEQGKTSPALVGLCLYGHCHFGVGFLPPVTVDDAFVGDRPNERHALLNAALPVSHPEFELNRPPRA
jgi:hypothetical protein